MIWLYAGLGLAGLVAALLRSSPALRYHAKLTSYYLTLTGMASLLVPVQLLRQFTRPRDVENMVLSAKAMKFFPWLIGLRYKISGADILSKEGGAVVVVNHQHGLDVLALFELWPIMKRCTVLAKRSLLWAGPFGIVAWLCGTIFIDRSKGKKARKILEEAAVNGKEDNTKVLVFPEGTRYHSAPGEELSMLPFKSGAFAAAIAAGVPIIPVVVSHYGFLDTRPGWRRFDGGSVDIRVMDPVDTSSLTDADVDRLAGDTRLAMIDVFRRL